MSEYESATFSHLKMTKRQLLWVIPLLALVGLAWAMQSGRIELFMGSGALADDQLNPPAPGLPVNVASISRVDSFQQQRTFTGTVRARNRSELAFELGGRISEVSVDEGDEVQAGQVIAALDTKTLRAQKNATIANREQAKALLAELMAGPRPEAIETARATVQAAQSELNRAKLNLERRKSLHEGRAISIEEYDQAVFSEQTARANHEAAKHQLAELLAGTRREKIAAQRSAVVQWDAAVAEIEVMILKSSLVAPFAGTVARRHLDPGTIAPASTPVVRLVEQQHLEAWVGMPVAIVAEMNVGDKENLLVDDIRYGAEVSAIIPELDPVTRTQTVLFTFEQDAGNKVVSGQLCEVAMDTVVRGSGFWIPTSALAKGVRGLWSVMVVVPADDGFGYRAEKRDIEIINTSENAVLARGTITQGDLLVVDGIHRIAEGQRVVPNEPN